MTTFPDGTHILYAEVPPIELRQLSNVFLPRDGLNHLEHPWRGYRRVKGVKYRAPGVDTHIDIEFSDVNVDDETYNLSHDLPMAVVVSDKGDAITYPPGIRLLANSAQVTEFFKWDMNVFLPVGGVDHAGYTWQKLALTKTFHIKNDQVIIDFSTPGIESKTYAPDELTHVMMAVWETDQVIGGLIQGQS